MRKSLVIIGVCFLIVSCTQSKQIASANVSLFQRWDLTFLNGQNISDNYAKPVYIEFDETESKVSGSAACNRFFGAYSQSGIFLKMGPLASTKMSCDEESNKLETELLRTLDNVDSYKIENNQLILFNNKELLARFRISRGVPDKLVGKWQLIYITGRKISFEGLYPDKKPFLVFQQGSRQFFGNSSCNAITGTYNNKKGEKLFNPGLSTLMACPGEGEQVFMQEFKKADKYQVKGDTLILYSKDLPSMKFMKQSL